MRFYETFKAAVQAGIEEIEDRGCIFNVVTGAIQLGPYSLASVVETMQNGIYWQMHKIELPKIDGSWAQAYQAMLDGYSVRRSSWMNLEFRYALVGLELYAKIGESDNHQWEPDDPDCPISLSDLAATDWEVYAKEAPVL
jgi:hypothetical protein